MSIKINNLVKRYTDFSLSIDNLIIESGELVKLYGNNGAGKTTLLQSILDLIEIDEGSIKIGGEKNTEFGDWKYHTASFLDESYLMNYLSVCEYLELVSNLYKKSSSDSKINSFAEGFFDYNQQKNKNISELSSGNKLKVGILSTLITEANYVLLDEPLANLDPRSKNKFIELINKYKKDYKATIIVSSHDIDTTNRLAGRNLILENGKLIFDKADVESLKQDIELVLTGLNNSE
jgi:ABC-2 type transport system ATP-binding protein